MQWLITGAAGFIGSNLAAHLLRRGDRVTGIDDLTTGLPANVDRVAAAGGQRFRFVEGSILDAGLLAEAMRGADVVVHLAAQVSVQKSFEDVQRTNEVNVAGFLAVHRHAAQAGVARLVYASSCAVYGDSDHLPLTEEAAARPLSPYAVSKLANEHYAEALRLRYPDLDAIGLRFFNIYGPWQDHRGGYAAVIPRWIDACLRQERPVVFGDGSASRDFCFVRDLAEVIEKAGRNGAAGPHRIFNVASGRQTSLRQLYEAIVAALAARGVAPPGSGPLHQPWRAGDIVHSGGSVARLREGLGIVPGTDLAAGIGALLDEQHRLG
jgi:UDP-N-acetylglucosamine 4-epimerase